MSVRLAFFINFLHSECSAIKAFVDEVDDSKYSADDERMIAIINHVTRYPQLKDYFELEADDLGLSQVVEIANENMPGLQKQYTDRMKRQIEVPWTRSLRLAIIDHMTTFDINISLLIDVVESYRLEAEIEELMEIVRALDILGAEKRLSEYEILLYIKLKSIEKNQKEWEIKYGHKLPVSFFDHVKDFIGVYTIPIKLGFLGSQRLIEFIANESNRNCIFMGLCTKGHLSLAQWLYSFGDINIHAWMETGFRMACYNGHLSMAQWLYNLGDINIHPCEDFAFRGACKNGHLALAQWLYSLGGVNIHAKDDFAFRTACDNKYLSVIKWLFSLGEISPQILQTCLNQSSIDDQVQIWLRSILIV
jgi:hypothetical protein